MVLKPLHPESSNTKIGLIRLNSTRLDCAAGTAPAATLSSP